MEFYKSSLKVNPQEASRPNPKQGHEPTKKRTSAEPKYKCQPAGKKQKVKGSCFVCGNVGHVARDCSKKKIAKQLTEQQESKDILKGSVALRFETENKHKELSAGSVLASSQPGSLRCTSEQTKQTEKVRNSSLRRTSEQTKQTEKVRNSSPSVAHQLPSKKKVEGYSSSQSIAHRPSSEQRMKFNNSQCGDGPHTWSREWKSLAASNRLSTRFSLTHVRAD